MSRILKMKLHAFFYYAWLALRIFKTTDNHAGYDFPWSPFGIIPGTSPGLYHDFHHSHNIGNYSTFLTFWDTVFGTNKVYF
jgi:sterol desaturase/sphingolipid hydroxylase (fatty acid hydroxylase superfamily)